MECIFFFTLFMMYMELDTRRRLWSNLQLFFFNFAQIVFVSCRYVIKDIFVTEVNVLFVFVLFLLLLLFLCLFLLVFFSRKDGGINVSLYAESHKTNKQTSKQTNKFPWSLPDINGAPLNSSWLFMDKYYFIFNLFLALIT